MLRVQPFSGTSNTITLADPWPADAAIPGASPDNPAHDTIWVYDFRQTPGYRVRVTSIEPEPDLKGAAVRVVPEGPEFWDYVLTGHYIPAPNQSLLQTRPVASNLRISEAQIVQGNTTFTELTATFDVTGPVGATVVRAAGAGGELQDVAQTVTRTATWRINEPGTYTIVVRPFSPDGEAGVAVQATYTTGGSSSFGVGLRSRSTGFAMAPVRRSIGRAAVATSGIVMFQRERPAARTSARKPSSMVMVAGPASRLAMWSRMSWPVSVETSRSPRDSSQRFRLPRLVAETGLNFAISFKYRSINAESVMLSCGRAVPPRMASSVSRAQSSAAFRPLKVLDALGWPLIRTSARHFFPRFSTTAIWYSPLCLVQCGYITPGSGVKNRDLQGVALHQSSTE